MESEKRVPCRGNFKAGRGVLFKKQERVSPMVSMPCICRKERKAASGSCGKGEKQAFRYNDKEKT